MKMITHSRGSALSKWIRFFRLLSDPLIFCFLVGGIVLTVFFFNGKTTPITSMYYILISLCSGIFGAMVAKNWLKFGDDQALEIKGKGSIRSLQLLLINIESMEKRVRHFIQKTANLQAEGKGDHTQFALVITYLEEMLHKSKSVEEEVINSIENWIEIVPEQVFDTQTRLVADLNVRIKAIETDIHQLEGGKSRESNHEQLAAKEKELLDVRTSLMKRQLHMDTNPMSGVGTDPTPQLPSQMNLGGLPRHGSPKTPPLEMTDLQEPKLAKCGQCKTPYLPNQDPNIEDGRCPECQQNDPEALLKAS